MARCMPTAFIGLLLLSGCASYLPSQPHFGSSIILPKGHPDGNNTAIVRTPTKYQSSIVQPTPLSCSKAEDESISDESVKKRNRNNCIFDLESDIDGAFKEYLIQEQSDIAKTNSFLSLTGFGLNAAGTVAGGASTKTILAAIAGGVGAVKASVSEDFLYKSTLQTLTSQMIADRAKIAASISTSMQSDSDTYTLHEAYKDLLGYYYAGTLLTALQTINADTGARATNCAAAAENAQAETKMSSFTGSTGNSNSSKSSNCEVQTYTYNFGTIGAEIEKLWMPDGKNFDAAAEAKLKACIIKLNVAANSITVLINASSDIDKARALGCYQASS